MCPVGLAEINEELASIGANLERDMGKLRRQCAWPRGVERSLEPVLGSHARCPPPHPTPFTSPPVCPCSREAGSGAACGEGAQNGRGAARFDAVTVHAETLRGGGRISFWEVPRASSLAAAQPRHQAARRDRHRGALRTAPPRCAAGVVQAKGGRLRRFDVFAVNPPYALRGETL